MKKEDCLSFLQNKEPLWGNWIIKDKIGEGSFSVVYRIEAKRWDRTDISALKVELINADGLLTNDPERRMSYIEQRKENIIRESAIMHQLRDDNHIVRYEDEMTYEIIEEGQLKGYVFLIRMEYLKCIYDLITQHQFDLSESNIRKLALEIARGIETIHTKGIIHRDIKPGNLFLSFNGEYKLGDFNVSKQSTNARTMAGADGYIAPEIYRAKSRVNETYSTSADIYSFGICLYQFMNDLCFPFESSTTPIDEAIDLRMSGKAIPKPKFASDAFSKIILKACSFDSNQRYASINELIDDLSLLDGGHSFTKQNSLSCKKEPITRKSSASVMESSSTPYDDPPYSQSDTHEDDSDTGAVGGELLIQKDDIFQLGKFNGSPLKWKVIAISDDVVTVVCCERIISKKIGDENWLNEHFYKYSFTSEEKQCIASRIVPAIVKRKYWNWSNDGDLLWCWDSEDDDYIQIITIGEHSGFNETGTFYSSISELYSVVAYFNLALLKRCLRNFERPFNESLAMCINRFKIGDLVPFGIYKNRPITWRILERTEFTITMLCDECIEYMQFHKDRSTNQYEKSDICKWLKTEFASTAFSQEESAYVLGISLLSKYEAQHLLKNTHNWGDGSWWWLSSPIRTTRVDRINGDGRLSQDGNCVDDPNGGVRPVIRIRIIPSSAKQDLKTIHNKKLSDNSTVYADVEAAIRGTFQSHPTVYADAQEGSVKEYNTNELKSSITNKEFYDTIEEIISLLKSDRDDEAKVKLSSLQQYTAEELYESRIRELNYSSDSDLELLNAYCKCFVNMVLVILAIIERDSRTANGYKAFIKLCEDAAQNGSCVAAMCLFDFYSFGFALFNGVDDIISYQQAQIERIKLAEYITEKLEYDKSNDKCEISLVEWEFYWYKSLGLVGYLSDKHCYGLRTFEEIIESIAEQEQEYFEISYGTLVVYYGKKTEVTLPDSVKVIGEHAFINNDFINSLFIPEGVITIKVQAFSGCKHLKNISFPDSLTQIESEAFSDCASLVEVSLYKKTEYDSLSFPAYTKIKKRFFKQKT